MHSMQPKNNATTTLKEFLISWMTLLIPNHWNAELSSCTALLDCYKWASTNQEAISEPLSRQVGVEAHCMANLAQVVYQLSVTASEQTASLRQLNIANIHIKMRQTQPDTNYLPWRFDLYHRPSSEEACSILLLVLSMVVMWHGKKLAVCVAHCVAALVPAHTY